MLNVRYDYGFLGKLFGVPRKLLSQLGGFCTSFTVEGRILKATFPAFPVPDKNPVKFWLDEEELAAFIEEQGGALTHDDITDWDAATAGFLTDDDYDTLSGAITDLSEIMDDILTESDGYLTVDDIGVTVAEEDHTHTTADISDWGTATADFLTDADMSAYALDADLAALEEDVADIADSVDAIDADVDDLFADLYDVSGSKKWVDLTTEQTISGTKRFKSGTTTVNSIALNGAAVSFSRDGTARGRFRIGSGDNPDFSIEAGNMDATTGNQIRLYAAANKTIVYNNPTATASDTTSKAVATCGWAANLFSAKTHHHDDVYSKLGHTHSGYASTNHTHSNYATTSSVSNLLGTVDELADVVDGILADYVSADELTTTLSAYSNTETIAANYATKTEVESIDGDLSDLADYVDEIDADLGDLADWADAIDADLYDEDGARKFVTTNTAQTITGVKTFKQDIIFSPNEVGTLLKIQKSYNSDDAIIISPDNKNIRLQTDANGVILYNAPTATASDTSSKAVATCGWAANLFSAKTHHHDDAYSKLGHTHSGYASTNHTHSGYASSSHTHTGVYANATHTHVAANITDLESAIDGKITTFSNTVSTTYATKSALGTLQNLVNEIDADLADVIDYVDSMDEDIADLASWYATGRTGKLTLGGVVSWTGTQLKQDKHVVTFTNGLITNVVTTAETVIDTPVLFEQS